MSTFFTSEAALKRRFEAQGRQLAYSGGAAAAWQTTARQRFSRLLGLHKLTAAPPEPQLRESVTGDGYTREEWLIQTEDSVWLPFSLLIPDTTLPAPLVLAPHGHASAGRQAVIGNRAHPEVAKTVAEHNYDYGVQLVRAGFVVACPDARGFGERREPARQHESHVLGSSCHHLMLAAAPLGLSVQGLWTFDLSCLLDFLLTDSRIDAGRVGVAGLSGGGMQALDLAAVDTRIKAAVVSGYFYGVQESLQVLNGNCDCNLVPGLWEAFDMGDIGGLLAGRALCIETGDADPLNGASGLANVISQVAHSQQVFDALGGTLTHFIFSGPHRWDGSQSIPWLVEQLCA
jgi:hypothetical protein